MQDIAQLGVREMFSIAFGVILPMSKAPAGSTVAARIASIARALLNFIGDEFLGFG